MEEIISVYKPIGKTPLQAIEKLKILHPKYEHIKIGYAGRLDPMAEGLLLLLIGETNKNKEQFEKLDKEYDFEAVFGFDTDSYDLLGKVTIPSVQQVHIEKETIINTLSTFTGTISQHYPPFSSVRVNGKPLFFWAYHNKLDQVTIPTKKVTISAISLHSLNTITASQLHTYIKEKINLVFGNFRQAEILEQWQHFFKKNSNTHFTILKATASCSSGTYIRSLVHSLGKKLNTQATTFSIKRTRIGEFTLDSAVKLW